ncbi:hypothetical protein KKH14_01130 [Patescibacteria group bacterium]|nr:hypothetical protein [Patescibacteria group bacterium]
MKIKYLIGFIVIGLTLIGSVVLAQNIQFPIEELGNCEDKSACKSYCDKSENTEACVAFAEKNNLMSKEKIGLARKFMAMESKGPGGCNGRDECNNFCNNIANIDECVAFSEKNNLMPPGELEEARKVQAAIRRGVKPPPCGNKKQCDVYCEESEHMEECIAFGVEAGFIQGKELEDVQKMLAAVKRGIKPPPCRGKEACDAYCSSPDNMEVCMNFAMEAGFMSENEKADSQKMLGALKKGIKPPNCRGKEACDTYCAEDAHVEECINFAIAAGFMDEKDAEMAKKTKGKGPGGCKGKDECEAFCNNLDNQETCFNFGKENGMIPEADLKQMEEGKQKFQESLQQMPPSVLECLNSEVGVGTMEKFKSGSAMPPREIGEKMRACYEKMGPPSGPEGQGESDREFQPGPGMENPGGQMMPQQAGPKPDGQMPPREENRERMMPREGKRMAPPPGEGMGMPPSEGINIQQMMPRESGPGTVGGMAPGEFVPMQPRIEQTAPAPQAAPAPEPAPAAPQTLLKFSPFGVILNFFLGR